MPRLPGNSVTFLNLICTAKSSIFTDCVTGLLAGDGSSHFAGYSILYAM